MHMPKMLGWKEMTGGTKLILFMLLILLILTLIQGAKNELFGKSKKRELRNAGFTHVKMNSYARPPEAAVSQPEGFKGCRLKLKYNPKSEWWFLKDPANDGVPVRLASEVFNRPHVQTYCRNYKQPQSP